MREPGACICSHADVDLAMRRRLRSYLARHDDTEFAGPLISLLEIAARRLPEPELLRAGAPERLGPVCKPLVQARAAKREVVEVLDDAADEEEVVAAPSPRQPRRRSRAR